MKILFLSIIAFMVMLTSPSLAEFYKWEDDQGNLHITDYPPPAKSAKKIKVHAEEAASDQLPPAASRDVRGPTPATRSFRNSQPRTSHEVILYTTSWCPYCKKAKQFFDSRNIPYTEYDIEKDPDAAERKKSMSSGGVPFAIVNGKHISGYAPAQYEAALNASE